MSKTESELNLMVLKLCEELLPKTKVAGDTKIINVMKSVRLHLEAQAGKDPAK